MISLFLWDLLPYSLDENTVMMDRTSFTSSSSSEFSEVELMIPVFHIVQPAYLFQHLITKPYQPVFIIDHDPFGFTAVYQPDQLSQAFFSVIDAGSNIPYDTEPVPFCSQYLETTCSCLNRSYFCPEEDTLQ